MFGPHVHGLAWMRGLSRATPIVTLAAALFGATCAFPTDKSDKVLVTLEAPAHVVLRGQEMSVYARAWQVVGTDSQPISNVDFAFSTGSSTIARVENNGGGYATVSGGNSGNGEIVARAGGVEKTQGAGLGLRGSKPLEMHSGGPEAARWGGV